ncbi:aminoglycoside phosphotransferase family protein [Actinoplanes sp. CA-030573]|uniref:aminoglycoside phosphotransferase family protein n=1 Tax=Actinoplanes sp. CA-030573 TaxID=3239898 RepID=UPI003D93E9DC
MGVSLLEGYDGNPAFAPAARAATIKRMTQAARVRIGWRDMPEAVRCRTEEIIGGGRVTTAESQAGGFSAGSADRVVTESGRRAFVKAVSPAINARSAELARQEMRITAALPAAAPVPRMLGGFDDGDWVVLVLEDVDGAQPRTPWVESEIDAAVTALGELAATLTPAPISGMPTAAEQMADDFAAWDAIAADPPADLDPWAKGHLSELSTAAARSLESVAHGDTLLHCDVRSDNMLVRPGGGIVVVDWPWACTGPAWIDRMWLACDIVVSGGDPARAIDGIDPGLVTDFAAGMAGSFERVGRLPDPPGIPTVRAFQRRWAGALRGWVRDRL